MKLINEKFNLMKPDILYRFRLKIDSCRLSFIVDVEANFIQQGLQK